MKIVASTIEELFIKSEKHEELMRLIDSIVHESTPGLKRYLFAIDSMTMVGYGEMPPKETTEERIWPLICLAPQKHTVNIYIAAEKNGVPLPQYFIDSFGKTCVGKSCIRIRSVRRLDTDILRELVRETLLWADLKKNKYGRKSISSI